MSIIRYFRGDASWIIAGGFEKFEKIATIRRLLKKSQQGYSHLENGRAELKIEDLILLCDFYALSADYIIGRTDDPRR